MKGHFIVVEGLEGAGKSSAVQHITQTLHKLGVMDIKHTREPGGTPIAEQLREIVKSQHQGEKLTSITELLLMYAARSQLIENVIKPALDKGKWMIGDRHDLSSRAYQGAGRGIDRAVLDAIRSEVLKGFHPSLTLYLDIEPALGFQRISARGHLDRIEQENIEFFVQVRQRYLEIAEQEDNIIVIDANCELSQVQQSISTELERFYANQIDT